MLSVDLVSCFPFWLFRSLYSNSNGFDSNLKIAKLFRLFKILRLLKLAPILRKMQAQLDLKNGLVKTITFIAFLLFLSHWFACISIKLASTYDQDKYERTWVEVYLGDDCQDAFDNGSYTCTFSDHSNRRLYISAIYFVITTMSTGIT